MIRVLFVLGTRPEAIKLAPVILHQKSCSDLFHVCVCVTGQHRQMLDQVLKLFNISPDFDLDIMLPGQTLCQSSARILAGLEKVFLSARPDMVIVQGDTTTTVCGALAGFYQQIPVAHVEAGLRTGDFRQPLPEEMNRVLTTRLATLHFAPTQIAKDNLLREGCHTSSISLTGNSGIDTILQIRQRLETGEFAGCAEARLPPSKKLILVTSHRRENFGAGFRNICSAVAQIARRTDVHIVFPVHPNPEVRGVAEALLRNQPNVTLLDSLPYVEFIDLMRRAHLIITDSGGIQEEAPSLGKPILLLREKTERMEGVLAGTVKLVGACEEKIVAQATELLDNERLYRAMAKVHSPYGDGMASARITEAIQAYFDRECSVTATAALHQLSNILGSWTRQFSAANMA